MQYQYCSKIMIKWF